MLSYVVGISALLVRGRIRYDTDWNKPFPCKARLRERPLQFAFLKFVCMNGIQGITDCSDRRNVEWSDLHHSSGFSRGSERRGSKDQLIFSTETWVRGTFEYEQTVTAKRLQSKFSFQAKGWQNKNPAYRVPVCYVHEVSLQSRTIKVDKFGRRHTLIFCDLNYMRIKIRVFF